MPSWRLTVPARQDLLEISEYGLAEWDLVRAESYIDALYEAFDGLARFPENGPRRDRLGAGIRSRISSNHVVYYRIEGERIDILRLLHVRSDPARHLTAE